MLSATAILIGKIILMIILLGAMTIVLLGISHIFHTDDLNTVEDDDILRHDVDDNRNVIGEKSVFYNFLVKNNKKKRE